MPAFRGIGWACPSKGVTMKALVRRAADTLLQKVVPHVVADAACRWDGYCYCEKSYIYYGYCCDTQPCVCRARWQAPCP